MKKNINHKIYNIVLFTFIFLSYKAYSQNLVFKNTNSKDVFYKYDKGDTVITFKILYKINPKNPIVLGGNITLESNNYEPIKFIEYPYNEKDSSFVFVLSRLETEYVLKSKILSIYITIHETGDVETYVKGQYKKCLTDKIINANLKR